MVSSSGVEKEAKQKEITNDIREQQVGAANLKIKNGAIKTFTNWLRIQSTLFVLRPQHLLT